ncbi:MAG: D-alanyl-D-alanine carboxypeptidase [Flavisolibacter sp.]|nr:D-alanyl-D-alanine carboxypeptidase [Flavisolibacter sp.]
MRKWVAITCFSVCLYGCTPAHWLSRQARKNVLNDAALRTAHVGISIYVQATGKWWYNYQGDKYFVPASNTKIPTCYAAMKYLGDSLVGLRYEEKADTLYIEPTGDPTFLHPDFRQQKVFDFLRATNKQLMLNIGRWQDKGWGSGWSWGDYSEYYMAERSAMPMYGNVVRFSNTLRNLSVVPGFFAHAIVNDSIASRELYPSTVTRELAFNKFYVRGGAKINAPVEVPFYTDAGKIIFSLLADTLQKRIYENNSFRIAIDKNNIPIYSQPTDSLLKPMMHRSDNFFAEQSLLMVSNQLLGVMNDAKVIDTLLKTDFKDLPQKPRWVDGSGLSRYNLFTPQDFVAILNKMKNDFGMERIKTIFPTGGTGTLSNFYKKDSGYLFAKTGTLSGVVALSGFLYTAKNRLLLFSVLVNNHQASAVAVRRAVEQFLQRVRRRY